MALTQLSLKPNTFLTVEDVADWLRVPTASLSTDAALVNRIIRFTNMATDMCEKYLCGPIKLRQMPAEIHDGDASNTIVPDYFPIRSIDQIKVDFNRVFPDSSIVSPINYVLRGAPDPASAGKLLGTDIVLVDDDNTAILGRIFSGSVIGSIQLIYKAGWGMDQTDIPGDLVNAVLMTIDYYSTLRDSRDMMIKSKAVNGQSITRQIGLPQEIQQILDTYKDYTFGRTNIPQKNVFTI